MTTLKESEVSEPLGASLWYNWVLRWPDIYFMLSAGLPVCVAFNSLSYERLLSRYYGAEIPR